MSVDGQPRLPQGAPPASAQGGGRIARFPWTTDVNPYQRLLYRELASRGYSLAPDVRLGLAWLLRNRGQVEVLHFHWRLERCFYRDRPHLPPAIGRWQAWPRALGFILRLLAARALGYRVLWTLHELYRQTDVSPRLERLVGFALGRLAHVVFVHHSHGAARVRTNLRVRRQKLHVVAHPSFIGQYPATRERRHSRRRLDLSERHTVYLCFGSLRADKQLELLVEAFRHVADPEAVLIFAGVPHGNAGEMRGAAERDRRVRLFLETVPDELVGELFAAADVFVSPRSDGWTSGSLILALSMGVPAVVADRPEYAWLVEDGGAGWLFTPGDPEALAQALEAAAADPAATRCKAAAALRRARSLPDWSELAAVTLRALREEHSRRAVRGLDQPTREPAAPVSPA